MTDWWNVAVEFLQSPNATAALRAAIKIAVGIVLGRLAGRALVRIFAGDEDPHRAMLLRRAAFYGIAGLFTASALMELGFDLGGLLGAAGILTVAVGFASQTSASNVISGLFLLGERPFAVGDMIKVNGTVGEVLSIDMLAVKLLCLEERAPRALFTGYGESSLDHEFRVWAKTENFLDLRNSISIEIKEAFDEAEIEIPFPHRTLYVGSETEPFPHRKVDESSDSPSAAAPGESSGEPPSGRSS